MSWTKEDCAELELAVRIAADAHVGQVDKGGAPYILHPLHLMGQMQGIEEKLVAVLHDVIEDGKETSASLIAKGIRQSVADAVDVLSRKRGETYGEMIDRIAACRLATVVKLKDLEHNLDLSRIANPTIKDFERRQKYMDAMSELTMVMARDQAH